MTTTKHNQMETRSNTNIFIYKFTDNKRQQ